MKYDDLDCRQKLVIQHVSKSDGRLFVLGGPGAGKTTTALWAARMVLDQPGTRNPSRVLFLTFSRSAVRQIATKAVGVLAGIEDRVEILTFHALAYRIISAFGRYDGLGELPPGIQSEARRRLLGDDHQQLTYDHLIPRALAMLSSSTLLRRLLCSRWQMLICDEVQDTNEQQWELVRLLSPPKVLCLGDVNQLIYAFIQGVSPERFHAVRSWCNQETDLAGPSHRDPTGGIPALAEAVTRRRFDASAVVDAVNSGRLMVFPRIPHESQMPVIVSAISSCKAAGAREIGVFLHSNAVVAEIAYQLDHLGIDHALVGISEAHAEALAALSVQCGFAVGAASDDDVRASLAIFLTAATRRGRLPELAEALIGRRALPHEVQAGVRSVEASLVEAGTGSVGDVVEVAARSWESIRIVGGSRPWRRAAAHFQRIARPFKNAAASAESIQPLMDAAQRARIEALVDLDYSEYGSVRLMNFHQTKGREADVVILVFRDDDYFGQEREPFEKGSRLLNVAISRARKKVIVVLSPKPHLLVRPFETLCEATRN